MYFTDLSEYSYNPREARPGLRNVGWLDKAHAFARGKLSDSVIDKLWQFSKVAVAQTRGFHLCEMCSHLSHSPLVIIHNSQRLRVGSAEIRVFGADDSAYACPNLLGHYVVAHDYLPPERFIQALLHGPAPLSKQYFDQLESYRIAWRLLETN
jgi:hypothetical protein